MLFGDILERILAPTCHVEMFFCEDSGFSAFRGFSRGSRHHAGSGQEVCTRDLVSSLVSAANRKLRQRKMSLTTEGAVLKPGSRVKDKIMAFEGKGGEEGPKAASPTGNGSVLVAMALPEGATSCSYPPSPTRTLGSPPQTPSVCSE